MNKNPLLHPMSLAFAAVAAFGALFVQPIIMGIGVVGYLGSVGFLAMVSGPGSSATRPHRSEIPNEDYALVRPLIDSRDAIDKLLKSHSAVPRLKVIGEEARREADRIIDHAFGLVRSRAALRKARLVESEANVRLEQLGTKSGDDSEVAKTIAEVDARLVEAKHALAELQSRIAVSAARSHMESSEEEDLTGMVERLRSLNQSLTEAEEMVGIKTIE